MASGSSPKSDHETESSPVTVIHYGPSNINKKTISELIHLFLNRKKKTINGPQ